MSRRITYVLVGAAAIAIVMFLVPPWVGPGGMSLGYAPIWTVASYTVREGGVPGDILSGYDVVRYGSVDFARLGLQVLALAAATGAWRSL